MTQKAIEDFIYDSHKRYHEKKRPLLKDNLGRFPELTGQLLRALEIEDWSMRNIVVTGSKGKGSVVRMLCASLMQLGYKVGTFTSPHHYDYRERIRVNGDMIPSEDFVSIGEAVKAQVSNMSIDEDQYLSPIGPSLAIALKYFEMEETDFNILECGRGGRYDDVTQVHHTHAVINQVFVEHKEYLGDTIEAVSFHKAGIITDETKYVFLNDQKKSVERVVASEAAKKGADLTLMTQADYFNYKSSDGGIVIEDRDLLLPVYSGYTLDNLSFVLKIIDHLVGKRLKIDQAFIDSIDFSGSLEKVSDRPHIFIDGCIHKESLEKILSCLPEAKRKYCVSGISLDKDYGRTFDLLKETFDRVYGTKPSVTHHHFVKTYPGVLVRESLEETLHEIYGDMTPDDLLLIIGIQGFVAEAKKIVEALL